VAVEPDGGARLVAEAGQSCASAERDGPLELSDHPEIAEALRLRLPAGRPDGAVTALPAIAGGRVHGVLELCASNGGDPGIETIERLEGGLRLPDFISSYTGGGYAIVLPETGADGARRSVARVRERLSKGRSDGSAEAPLSAGIVTYPHPAVTQADDLFALVEAALARGKAQTGERVGVAD
jgi:hypothetical protein